MAQKAGRSSNEGSRHSRAECLPRNSAQRDVAALHCHFGADGDAAGIRNGDELLATAFHVDGDFVVSVRVAIALDLVTEHRAADRAGCRRDLATGTAAYLVADQAADHGAGYGANAG